MVSCVKQQSWRLVKLARVYFAYLVNADKFTPPLSSAHTALRGVKILGIAAHTLKPHTQWYCLTAQLSQSSHIKESLRRKRNWVFISIFAQIMMHRIREADWKWHVREMSSARQKRFYTGLENQTMKQWWEQVSADGTASYLHFIIDKWIEKIQTCKRGMETGSKGDNPFSKTENSQSPIFCWGAVIMG